jgi:hypothetical protein
MRAFLLSLIACILFGCVSATREREAQCLGSLMTGVWQSQDKVESAEHAWRTAHYARYERENTVREAAVPSVYFKEVSVSQVIASHTLVDLGGSPPVTRDQEEELYRKMIEMRSQHREQLAWFRRVAQRIETRIEEDEMLYPILGTLFTSPAILFYPVVRWNVRSVLWEGGDPDAEDDPVRRFCITRLAAVDPPAAPPPSSYHAP